MDNKEKETPRALSRREFLKDAGLVIGGATVGSLALLNACSGTSTTETVTNTVTATGAATTKTVTSTASGAASTVTVTAPAVTVTSTAAPATTAAASVSATIYDINGAHEILSLFAARLGDLNGKKIAGLAADPTKWQTHRTFPYIFDQIKAKYPTVTIIPQTEFTMGTGINDDAVVKQVKDRGADGVIVGNSA
jgi:hypothetical protein